MSTGVRQKYNVAVNGKGYILRGAPGTPLYDKRVIQSQVDRLAISDVQYSDFSGANLFYIAQTDWSAGIKDEKKWRDDGKYYYSINVDTYSQQGSIALEKTLTQVGTDLAAGAEIICGAIGKVGGIIEEYIGTDDATADSKPRIYEWNGSDWSSIKTFTNTTTNAVAHFNAYKNNMFAFSVGTSTVETVQSYDGSSWTDHTASIVTASTLTQVLGARAATELAGVLYFGIDDFTNDNVAIMSYDGSSFTEEVYIDLDARIVSMAAYAGKLYYLLDVSTVVELRVFDPSTSSDTLVRTFLDVSVVTTGVGDKYLRVYAGKLIVTIPTDNIYEFDGTSLISIFDRTDFRSTINTVTHVDLRYGCTEANNKLYWYNLIYDGEVFFNYKLSVADDENDMLIPLCASENGDLLYWYEGNQSEVYTDSGSYKSTDNKNYVVMNEFDQISSIDKLLDNITIIYDELDAGTEIEVDYSIDEGSTWLTLGNVTATNDSGTTKKTFFPPSTVQYNKIYIRVKLNTTNASNTPVLNDVILAYKPFPDYKIRWSMTVDASKQISLLNKQQEQRTSMEISNELWNLMNVKEKIVLEDTDYFDCTLESSIPK